MLKYKLCLFLIYINHYGGRSDIGLGPTILWVNVTVEPLRGIESFVYICNVSNFRSQFNLLLIKNDFMVNRITGVVLYR